MVNIYWNIKNKISFNLYRIITTFWFYLHSYFSFTLSCQYFQELDSEWWKVGYDLSISWWLDNVTQIRNWKPTLIAARQESSGMSAFSLYAKWVCDILSFIFVSYCFLNVVGFHCLTVTDWIEKGFEHWLSGKSKNQNSQTILINNWKNIGHPWKTQLASGALTLKWLV